MVDEKTALKAENLPLKQNQILVQSKFQEAQYRRTVYFCEAAYTTTLKDVLRPEFWANVAAQLQARDRIEVYAEDGTYYAELLVVQVPEKTETKPKNWAAVELLRFCDLTKNKETGLKELPDNFEAKYLGPAQKWGIRRKSDGQILVDKKSSKVEAVTAFGELSKQMAA